MTERLGELAALGTATCWATSALFFASAGARIGSLVVNFLRLVIAFLLLSAYTWVARGSVLPTDASAHAWLWLSISGLVGFGFGDLCLFRALVSIGPRLSSLIMSMAPPLTAIIGWLILGETLRGRDLLGMVLTVAGIAWAIVDQVPDARTGAVASLPPRRSAVGVLLALGGALGQAGGLVLSKHGMGDYDAFAATQIRVVAGLVAFAAIFWATRWWPRVRAGFGHRSGLVYTGLGAVFGPFLGVSLSLISVQHTTAGVAASIMATSPILVIPIVMLVRKERVGMAGIAGTLLAVFGVVLLFS